MFIVGSIQSRLIATLVAFCYLVLAGASAVHEVLHTHGAEESVAQHCSSYDVDTCYDNTTHPHTHATLSLPCFLCLVGHPLSPVAESYNFLSRVQDIALQNIPEDADIQSAPHQLPSLRAPPTFS